MSVFVHAQGIKTAHAGGGVKKWQNSVHVVVKIPPNVLCNGAGLGTSTYLIFIKVICDKIIFLQDITVRKKNR